MKRMIALIVGLTGFALVSCNQPLSQGPASIDQASGQATSRALAGFPDFQYLKVVEPANPQFNPTGEFIFPHVIKASDHLSNPLGTYYMYYAPHDAPGGIALAYSNNIEGPYTEYAANPIISRTFGGKSVTHVSSPHVLWMPEYNKYIMYYHGENTTNRWAYSVDGVNWSYGGVALGVGQFGSGYTECQYARVYRYTIPGQNNRYIMLHMLLYGTGNGRRIALSTSVDGKTFTPYDANLIVPEPDGTTNLSAPHFYVHNGKYYVVYHGGTGNMYITEVGKDFTLENHLGVFYDSSSGAPDNGRSASPWFMQVGSYSYMFYEAGQRGSTKLALARAPAADMFYEAEALSTTSSGASQADFTDTLLSNGAANKLNADGVDDYVEYTAYLPSGGTWHLSALVKKQNTRGIMRLFLPQANAYVGSSKDLYASSDMYEEIYLGTYSFASSGDKQLRFVVEGKNAASGGYNLAIDAIRITK